MTIERKNINLVRDLAEKHEAYHDAKAKYDKARKIVDKMTGGHTETYGLYTVRYDDTTTSAVNWDGIAEALGLTTDEAKERFTTRTATTRFKGVYKEA